MFKNIHKFLTEFSGSTSVHGINYFGDQRRHWTERVFWIFVFVVSMSACIWTVHVTYEKWQNSPIIVTQDDKLTAIWEIPFPAVTICPAAKINELSQVNLTRTQELLQDAASEMFFSGAIPSIDALKNFKFNKNQLEELNITEEEIQMLEAINHICPEAYIYSQSYVEQHPSLSDALKILETHALGSDDFFYYQALKSVSKDDLFERVFTEEGFCYTFNGLRNFDIFKENS